MSAERVISVEENRCWFNVEVNDSDLLEFILMDAAQRAGKEPDWYVYELWNELNDEFHGETSQVISQESYGKVRFELSYERTEDLSQLLDRCAKVVARWANRYRVHAMKRS